MLGAGPGTPATTSMASACFEACCQLATGAGVGVSLFLDVGWCDSSFQITLTISFAHHVRSCLRRNCLFLFVVHNHAQTHAGEFRPYLLLWNPLLLVHQPKYWTLVGWPLVWLFEMWPPGTYTSRSADQEHVYPFWWTTTGQCFVVAEWVKCCWKSGEGCFPNRLVQKFHNR